MLKLLKYKFIICFLITQLFLIFFEIHRQSKNIKLSYQKQKLEKNIAELLLKKQKLKQEIESAKNLSKIKNFAVNNLGMQKVELSKLKKLGD